MWYAAHILMLIKFQDGRQDIHPVWEQIHIIEADTSDNAYEEADRIGALHEESDSDAHTYGGRPVRWKYGGVRRLAECVEFFDTAPESGNEVAYLSYFLENESDLDKMLNNQSARITLDGEDIK